MNDMVSTDHPENNAVTTALREVEIISAMEWCYETTYKIQFTAGATSEQIEALLDEIETAFGLTPTDDQPEGHTIWIHREWVEIEIE